MRLLVGEREAPGNCFRNIYTKHIHRLSYCCITLVVGCSICSSTTDHFPQSRAHTQSIQQHTRPGTCHRSCGVFIFVPLSSGSRPVGFPLSFWPSTQLFLGILVTLYFGPRPVGFQLSYLGRRPKFVMTYFFHCLLGRDPSAFRCHLGRRPKIVGPATRGSRWVVCLRLRLSTAPYEGPRYTYGGGSLQARLGKAVDGCYRAVRWGVTFKGIKADYKKAGKKADKNKGGGRDKRNHPTNTRSRWRIHPCGCRINVVVPLNPSCARSCLELRRARNVAKVNAPHALHTRCRPRTCVALRQEQIWGALG